jgi:hypothetical protein
MQSGRSSTADWEGPSCSTADWEGPSCSTSSAVLKFLSFYPYWLELAMRHPSRKYDKGSWTRWLIIQYQGSIRGFNLEVLDVFVYLHIGHFPPLRWGSYSRCLHKLEKECRAETSVPSGIRTFWALMVKSQFPSHENDLAPEQRLPALSIVVAVRWGSAARRHVTRVPKSPRDG